MFSIAAINDSDASSQWEPLAPSKEAQEFYLSQKYNEGLLKLQSKDYSKARELLEEVLKDPLIVNIQVDNIGSDHHLLQLRFLSLKNLAAVFLQLGTEHYQNALHCYLQAVDLDKNDSVVWNKLGTLSCTMGLLSTSRWAFEQGLLCSPNNWNCMEKLLEVLIAIGDEVACLSIANILLRRWPSHARALHVKITIEDTEAVPFAPRGIDNLEPKHPTLHFSRKRKRISDEDSKQRKNRKEDSMELQLPGATWSALLDGILGLIKCSSNESSAVSDDNGCPKTDKRGTTYPCNKVDIHVTPNAQNTVCSEEEKVIATSANGGNTPGGDTKTSAKDKDSVSDREQPHERRSTRLESLRSRKSGKEGSESSSKDAANLAFQLLDPFIPKKISQKDISYSEKHNCSCSDIGVHIPGNESEDVMKFISKRSNNFGPHHIGHLLLEEFCRIDMPYQDYFANLLELEKQTRNWGQDRSPVCSLFLAELYFDQALCTGDRDRRAELFSDASYHLCKLIESMALDYEVDYVNAQEGTKIGQHTLKMNNSGKGEISTNGAACTDISLTDTSQISQDCDKSTVDKMLNKEASDSSANYSFWVRFFWLSGCLSMYSSCNEKACDELQISMALLRSSKESSDNSVHLPHCKSMRVISVDSILHEMNHIKLDSVLTNNNELITKLTHSECMELLPPLLFSSRTVYPDIAGNMRRDDGKVLSMELTALELLVSACQKVEPKNVQVHLNSLLRKLQILVAAGTADSAAFQREQISFIPVNFPSEMDLDGSMERSWIQIMCEAVKDTSQVVSQIKSFMDQSAASEECLSSVVSAVPDIQSSLVSVMCCCVKTIQARKSSGSVVPCLKDHLDCSSLVEASIAFCKLQHLDHSIPVRTQVELLVAVHDLLAEYGLCCAGTDNKGEEGTFLKFAIKHLLALDVKMKSLNTNSLEEEALMNKGTEDVIVPDGGPSACDEKIGSQEEEETETEEIQSCIDSALDQAFFCLYGLKINPDSSSEDDLAIHKNTSLGDYQTKEQCADVFHYILPYAKALSRNGLIKLRRVLRAIRKHFPHPPSDVLAKFVLENFLDGPHSSEKKLCEIYETNGSPESIFHVLFPCEKGYETFKNLSAASSGPFCEVYANLYYYIAQAEDISASDKHAGFVLKEEGVEFVEQNANLFKYDLLYNPLRFESWQKLANIYDEEVDLLLNDGSKHMNILDWRKNAALTERVEIGRRRSRRCLLVSLILSKTPAQQSQIHELLALVYYDSLQNVVPFYDQRSAVPLKDSAWKAVCRSSMKHFEKALALKPEWLHAFYLGKLSEKLGLEQATAFSYYKKAMSLNQSAVDPFYRMHASRLKLLYTQGRMNFEAIKVVAEYSSNQSAMEAVLEMLNVKSGEDLHATTGATEDSDLLAQDEERAIQPHILDESWHILYEDCLASLATCAEHELKHFHKARFKIAQGYYQRGEPGDIEKGKDELSFCFKSHRSPFTVNMWEIDGSRRRKNPNVGVARKSLEVTLSESSRKFITCIRKYLLFYLNLLEKTRDLSTLERAYTYLRTDKRFALCLADIVPVGLGKYIQVIMSLICCPESGQGMAGSSAEQLLEKMFYLFLDHANVWADLSSLPEVNGEDLSDSNLYGYIHQYINFLERNARLETLEGLNEKIRKRFKAPKSLNSNFSKVCKHASLAWCRSILFKLASLTVIPEAGSSASPIHGLQLYVDLQPDELLTSLPEGLDQPKGLDINMFETFSKMKNTRITQTLEDNMEAAVSLMRSAYSFYRDSSCTTFPSGINIYTVLPSQSTDAAAPSQDIIDILDLSIPRKLLLWAYTLVHGRYAHISLVVKVCEEMKARLKRGTSAAAASAQPSAAAPSVAHPPTAAVAPEAAPQPSTPVIGSKEKPNQAGASSGIQPDLANTSAAPQEEPSTKPGSVNVLSELQNPGDTFSQLHPCSTTKGPASGG